MPFKNGKLSAELTALCQCILRFFHSICLKYRACHEKVRPGHTKCCTVMQNHRSKPEELMLQNATALRKSAPWPPNISDEDVYCTAPAKRHASLQILCKYPTPAIVFGNARKPLRFAHFLARCRIPCACHAKPHLNVQKWSEHLVLCTFWFGNVLRATTACAFSTSQLPKVLRRWSACAFWLGNVLRAATACTFSASRLPRVVWDRKFFTLLTSKCASRHNGVQFFISHLASLLFDPPEPQIIGKTQRFATFLPFRAPASSFFCLFLFSDLLSSSLLSLFPPLLFHLSILSEVWLLIILIFLR